MAEQPTPCVRCGTPVPRERVQWLTVHSPTARPHVTCIPCQQLVEQALRFPSPDIPTDRSQPAAPAPKAPRCLGPRSVTVTVHPDTFTLDVVKGERSPFPEPNPQWGGWERDRIPRTPLVLADGSTTTRAEPTSPGIPSPVRAELRDQLSTVGIVSASSYRALSTARGQGGIAHRRKARKAIRAALRHPQVTAWLAAQDRAESDARRASSPAPGNGDGIAPGPESIVDALDISPAEYMDTSPTYPPRAARLSPRAVSRPRPRAGHPEDQRRSAESMTHVDQPSHGLGSREWADHLERQSHRVESNPWTRGPDGAPLGATLVTKPDGTQYTDLPEWPEPEPKPSPTPDTTAADRKRRERARKRAARLIASAAASGDVQRLAAAQRAAERQVSVAASSHPWE